MLNKLGFRYSSVRTLAAAATIGAAVALVVPATASAQPGIEGSVDGGIATINGSIGDAGNDIANGIASGSIGDITDGIATGDVNAVLGGLAAGATSARDIANGLANGDPRAILNGLASGSGGGGSFTPTQGCNASTISGGAGITSTKHQIGRGGPTSFVVGYETYSIPDLIEVFYEGRLIQSTGYVGDDINQGTGALVVNVPPGLASSVLVRVTGPNYTDWNYTVQCP
ncbi:hypothetical protein B2J88_24260 [Rhodococcus sp. SRB_17]|uniref:hypothetical protein n=1 Tax=Rhodococcus sp. OK302 TaxID=1882769 RepID=UPI000B9449F7|nr:hypothetical protein [Rhodococcus sp. OK302]NMM87435.1 hypothetical protein [Rhodococcus sp. SRB_17]OYD71161.1 hypothetical protein BDB13_4815 [Rhodococcus sp. OK302]